MSAYNLYPGLKQILEDKRILGVSVCDAEKSNFLRAEQFVLDVRPVTIEEYGDISKTFKDLRELSLDKGPYDRYVLHHISQADLSKDVMVISYYIDETKELIECSILSDSMEKFNHLKNLQNQEISFAFSRSILITMLATRGVIKERREMPKSREGIDSKPHKKGTGAYTILRAPRANEHDNDNESVLTGSKKRPHFRRGHIRKFHPDDKTRWVWVSPCFINAEPEIQRKAYLVAS
jgi:hypothetical protein